MSTGWDIQNRQSSGLSAAKEMNKSAMDLFEVGFRTFKETLNVMEGFINKSAKKCKCGCSPHHGECMDPMMDCYPCGPQRSDTDLKLEARFGERRMLAILIENNRDFAAQVNINLGVIMDACGNTIDAGQLIDFAPSTFTIPPCSCKRVLIGVNLKEPFVAGMAYYAEIKIDGDCCDKNISLGIWVQADNYIDYHSLCDPCRPKKGHFVEFRNCDCGCCAEGKMYYICEEQATSTPPTHVEG